MITRQLSFALIAAAALAPAISNASVEKPAFQACLNAFEKSMADAGSGIPAYKVVYHDQLSGSIAQYYPGRISFDLQATSPKTGLIARARCFADNRGTILALSPLPVDANFATVATLD